MSYDHGESIDERSSRHDPNVAFSLLVRMLKNNVKPARTLETNKLQGKL